MGKRLRRRWLRRCLAVWAIAPVVAAGCASNCPSCGGFVAEGPPAGPAYTYVYTEGPAATGDGSFLAVVDVPPSKSLSVLRASKTQPAAPDTGAVAMASPPPVQQCVTERCVSDVRPAEFVASTPAPAALIVQHTQPMPKPVDVPPSLKIEPAWEEAPKLDVPPDVPPVEAAREEKVTPAAAAPKEPAPAEPVPATPRANGYGHAEDYTWLAGELQFSRTKGWRLRYAGFDEEDQYGGSVTLMEDHRLEPFKDGQMVMVRGRIVNADGKNIAPPFKIEAVEASGRAPGER